MRTVAQYQQASPSGQAHFHRAGGVRGAARKEQICCSSLAVARKVLGSLERAPLKYFKGDMDIEVGIEVDIDVDG